MNTKSIKKSMHHNLFNLWLAYENQGERFAADSGQAGGPQKSLAIVTNNLTNGGLKYEN